MRKLRLVSVASAFLYTKIRRKKIRAYFVPKEHIELDLHGMTVEEAKRYLELSIVLLMLK